MELKAASTKTVLPVGPCCLWSHTCNLWLTVAIGPVGRLKLTELYLVCKKKDLNTRGTLAMHRRVRAANTRARV